ncbi:MAG TPA: putative nucleotidyltransferase substrate binding domain-containing protein [Desulfuromonadaceae bacterium]|jgi:signal-transduction protein with cAMP-binding, CBS, and nucleotidyltransferase domain
MSIFLLSKINGIENWRVAEEFGTAFHQALCKQTANLSSDQSLALFDEVGQELEQLADYYDEQWVRMRQMVDQAAAISEADRLRVLTKDFFTLAYSVFGRNSSASAFFLISQAFIKAVTGSVVALAKGKLGVMAERLPPLAVVALGPTGRLEFSPFCRLQLLLMHDETEPTLLEPLRLMGRLLHEGFESVGLLIHEVITPRNPDWCGTPLQWQKRLSKSLEHGVESELINLLRLADQTILFADQRLKEEFGAVTSPFLKKNCETLSFLVNRLHGLSNGIGLMGGLRLEKVGPYRGLFALLDHALLPLTASITALYLLDEGAAVTTPDRIRGLVSRQELNVKTGEYVLQAWHALQELRLLRELEFFPDTSRRESLFLDPEKLSVSDTEQLREALETIAALQRQVFITFSNWEEQSAC